MEVGRGWKEFELLDAGYGEKLEKWGPYVLQRPDPQAFWPHEPWAKADARYQRSKTGGGHWEENHLPEIWTISYPSRAGQLRFQISLMGFKHTGLFPEQALNWDWMQALIQERREKKPDQPLRILNLFAYTGGATVACAAAGATEVVHVDASKKMVARAKENLRLSGLEKAYVRTITEDVNRFVARELRRGRQYEGILMDPPAYGRGPSGELWQLEEAISPLVEDCSRLLSDDPLFFLVNAYSSTLTAGGLENLLRLSLLPKKGGRVEGMEIALPAKNRDLALPCGFSGRWSR